MRWLGKAAVLWVLYEAPDVPAHLLSTLIAVAAHTGADGKGAYISAATVAEITRKAERNAKKDLAELVRLGLLLPGDQRIVAHIRTDRRPNVYDLPMPRGVVCVTPSSLNGVTHTTARGDAQGPDGVMQASPEEFLKNSGKRARDASGDDAPSAHHEDPPCACGAQTNRETMASGGETIAFIACTTCGNAVEDCEPDWCRQKRQHLDDPPSMADSIAALRRARGWWP